MPLWITILAPLLLTALLTATKRGSWVAALAFKTALSLLFVVVALTQPSPAPLYADAILWGLILCLGGDVALALPSTAAFRVGLLLFLLGHVAYTLAFAGTWLPGTWALGIALAAAACGAVIYQLLADHLGSFKIPVLAYIVAISLMLTAAAGVMDHPYGLLPRRLVFLGALCFYISDLFVARQRFIEEAFANRLVGLTLYYSGQFMLAASIGKVARLAG